MKKDRLREDRDEVRNLDDLIEARKAQTSHFAQDKDALEEDVQVPQDTDVDEALTFPHPKNNHAEDIDLMDTPHEDEMDDDQQDWQDDNLLPSDYGHDYDEAIRAHAVDEVDEIAEERRHQMSRVASDDLVDEPTIERMSNTFAPDEETERMQAVSGEPTPEQVGEELAREHTAEEARREREEVPETPGG